MSDQERVTVGITHAIMGFNPIRNIRFNWDSVQVARSLPNQPGIVDYKVKSQWVFGVAWTFTAWHKPEDLDRFITSKQHGLAMKRSYSALRESQYLRIDLPLSEVPKSWPEIWALFSEQKQQGATPNSRFKVLHH
jgi:hypothetical protein